MYIKIDSKTNLPVAVSDSVPEDELLDMSWQDRWQWKTFQEVERLARYVTAMTGKSYIPVDNTESVSPRYDIMEMPKVGDPVSYGFNGDYYPDGHITAITKKFQITTSTGNKYRRVKNTSGWKRTGGTWGLVKGHIYEQNPHF